MTRRTHPYRRARSGDLESLFHLQSALERSSETLLEFAVNDGTVFVSVVDDTVVGYVAFLHAPTRDGAYVAELVVDPDYRREGHARGLIEAVIATADGPVTLLTSPENERARSLYTSLGFSEIGRRRSFYGEADGDALVFRH